MPPGGCSRSPGSARGSSGSGFPCRRMPAADPTLRRRPRHRQLRAGAPPPTPGWRRQPAGSPWCASTASPTSRSGRRRGVRSRRCSRIRTRPRRPPSPRARSPSSPRRAAPARVPDAHAPVVVIGKDNHRHRVRARRDRQVARRRRRGARRRHGLAVRRPGLRRRCHLRGVTAGRSRAAALSAAARLTGSSPRGQAADRRGPAECATVKLSVRQQKRSAHVAEIVIVRDAAAAGELVADAILDLVAKKPDAVLGLATGSSPLADLRGARGPARVDLSRVRGFALDEYVGLPAGHPESYRAVITREVVEPLGLTPRSCTCPAAGPIENAGADYERAITEAGGVDLQILGIGTHRPHRIQRTGLLVRVADPGEDAGRAHPARQRALLRLAGRRADALHHPGAGHDPAGGAPGAARVRRRRPRRSPRRWRGR